MRGRRHWLRRCGMLCLVVLALTGCTEDDGNEDGDGGGVLGDFTGNYVGTVQDSNGGNGTMQVSLTQVGDRIAGSAQTTFANAANNTSGTLSGTASGPTATLTLTPTEPRLCPLQVTAMQVNPARVQGTYQAFNCSQSVVGSFDISRQ